MSVSKQTMSPAWIRAFEHSWNQGLVRWPEVKSRFGETLTERWFTDDDAAFPGGETGFETRTRGLAAPVRGGQATSHERAP